MAKKRGQEDVEKEGRVSVKPELFDAVLKGYPRRQTLRLLADQGESGDRSAAGREGHFRATADQEGRAALYWI
jgi:hypothetical protein